METEDKNPFIELVEFATKYADGLDVLWTVLIGLAAAALFFSRPIYRALFENSSQEKSDSQPTTVVVQNYDSEYFRELIRKELENTTGNIEPETRTAHPNKPNEQTVSLADAIEQLSMLRQSLQPPDLKPELFPSDLDVIDFDPNGKFRIRSPMSTRGRIFVGLFCLPYYLIFPGLLGGVFGLPWVGGAIGAVLWLWRNRLGSYVSIDLQKEKHTLIMPAAASSYDGFPDVTLSTSYNENEWKVVLSIAGQEVIERASKKEPSKSDLNEFAQALKWRFRHQIEIAEGVYISP